MLRSKKGPAGKLEGGEVMEIDGDDLLARFDRVNAASTSAPAAV